MTGVAAGIVAAAAVLLLAASFAMAAACYRLGRRDGLEEKTWLAELPPIELGEALLTPLDLSDTTDMLIHHARMESTE